MDKSTVTLLTKDLVVVYDFNHTYTLSFPY